MPTRIHIGAKDLRGDLKAYAKRFDLLEVRGMGADDLRLAPSSATLRRWRRQVPPNFEFSVVAGPNLAKLKPSPAFDAELAAMLEAATVLEARVLVVSTPTEVTPTKLWRDRLAAVLDRLPRDARTLVWEPSGLWETDDAAAQGAKWGIAVAVDPSRDEVPSGPVAYARLPAIGGTRAYSTAALERVAERLRGRREAYVLLETSSALKEAKTLRGLVRTGGARRAGFGRIVRPRGAPLRIGDDEQDE